MRIIDTSIAIAAEPERVWGIVVDFDRYSEWNPFIVRAAGEPVVGGTLTLDMQPPGEPLRTHHPTVTVAEPGRHIQWLGTLFVAALFAARHEFVLEPDPAGGGGTALRHRETFTGLLVPLLKRTLDRTEEGFAALNEALKRRAETGR